MGHFVSVCDGKLLLPKEFPTSIKAEMWKIVNEKEFGSGFICLDFGSFPAAVYVTLQNTATCWRCEYCRKEDLNYFPCCLYRERSFRKRI